MPVKRKTTTRKTVTKRTTRKRATSTKCRPTYEISKAGSLLKKRRSSRAGSALATEGKAQKARRKKRGCLSGATPKRKVTKRKATKRLGKSFELTPRQKRNLPLALQRAIVKYHRGR